MTFASSWNNVTIFSNNGEHSVFSLKMPKSAQSVECFSEVDKRKKKVIQCSHLFLKFLFLTIKTMSLVDWLALKPLWDWAFKSFVAKGLQHCSIWYYVIAFVLEFSLPWIFGLCVTVLLTFELHHPHWTQTTRNWKKSHMIW